MAPGTATLMVQLLARVLVAVAAAISHLGPRVVRRLFRLGAGGPRSAPLEGALPGRRLARAW